MNITREIIQVDYSTKQSDLEKLEILAYETHKKYYPKDDWFQTSKFFSINTPSLCGITGKSPQSIEEVLIQSEIYGYPAKYEVVIRGYDGLMISHD